MNVLVAEWKGFVLHKLTALSQYLTEMYTCISKKNIAEDSDKCGVSLLSSRNLVFFFTEMLHFFT